ncbi:MAG: hypothetical protein ABIK96_13945 [bacterium]
MKKSSFKVKNCGELRVVAGNYKIYSPQANYLSFKELNPMRVIAGNSLYPIRARARAHVYVEAVIRKNYPQLPATTLNPLNDKNLGCGEWFLQLPAIPRNYPQAGGWAKWRRSPACPGLPIRHSMTGTNLQEATR